MLEYACIRAGMEFKGFGELCEAVGGEVEVKRQCTFYILDTSCTFHICDFRSYRYITVLYHTSDICLHILQVSIQSGASHRVFDLLQCLQPIPYNTPKSNSALISLILFLRCTSLHQHPFLILSRHTIGSYSTFTI